jgi:hypothetical protein
MNKTSIIVKKKQSVHPRNSHTNQATCEGSPENARTGSFCGYCSGWLVREAKSSRLYFPAPFLASPFWEGKKVKLPVGKKSFFN